MKEKIEKSKTCLEHPFYHPEGTLYNHILMVTAKALCWYYGRGFGEELIWAALFHDITKPDYTTRMVNYDKIHGDVRVKGTYQSNERHAETGADFWYQWAKDNDIVPQAYLQRVHNIIHHHMDLKYGSVAEKATRKDYIQSLSNGEDVLRFMEIDDMVGRYSYLSYIDGSADFPHVSELDGYAGKVTFFGLSPLQCHRQYSTRNNTDFTVVVSGVPVTIPLVRLPLFLKGTKFYELIV